MANEKNIAFRSALSGYNREDVNRYILEMNRNFEEQELALRRAAEEAAAHLDTLTAEKEELTRAKEEAERVIAAHRENADRLKEENTLLREKADSAAARLEDAMKKISALEAELTECRNTPASAEASEKSQKYDQISAQIGDIMIGASSSADKIIAAANAEAGRIMAETEEEAIYIRSRLSDTADEMLTSISGRLHVSTDHCVTELMTALREMRDSASALIRDFEKRSSDLSDKIDYYQSNVSETIAASLAEMDEKYGIRKPEAK